MVDNNVTETNDEALVESESVIKDGDLTGVRPDIVRTGFIIVIAIILFFILKTAWGSSMKMNAPFIIFLVGLVSLLVIIVIFVIGI